MSDDVTPKLPEESWFVWDTTTGHYVHAPNELYVSVTSKGVAEVASGIMPNWKHDVYSVHPRYRETVEAIGVMLARNAEQPWCSARNANVLMRIGEIIENTKREG